MRQSLQLKYKVLRCHQILKQQFALFLNFGTLIRLVAVFLQNLSLQRHIKLHLDNDEFAFFRNVDRPQSCHGSSPQELLELERSAPGVGEARICVDHPLERQHDKPVIVECPSVLLFDVPMELVGVVLVINRDFLIRMRGEHAEVFL